MPRVIVFDVNETLLDMRALDPLFTRMFGAVNARQAWFNQVLQSAFVTIITGAYVNFTKIWTTALEMTAARYGTSLSADDGAAILDGMRNLPPHADVPAALERLKSAGLRLAALTNSTEEVAITQLTNAGIAHFFENIFSADIVRRLKPAPEPYEYAANRLYVPTRRIRMVATHAWDIAGALHAGCAAAFVARPGMVLDPLFPRPDIIGTDMAEVADQILAIECS
ncbi:MAG: haloacid dehalogenase type II [Roseiflexus sp.]|nr:haloacid dehalogenase type II [Roseiflexus sp.]MCS7288376.1 haloacid dehalogenase type II [Roseiflexus sp.]MDW8146526.1 haloacid dehalogenase type II [Roseiflexaceae bacterium]MDW8231195.1 haloacid dehalogenase type II [Roseiflexaceae bacterium]